MKEKKTFPDWPSGPPPPEESKPSYRILVVDDEKAVRNQHLDVLTAAGYEVIGVADGALAWYAIQNQHFDLMITDNSMPKVTGVEVIIKLTAAKIRLPVIMATGALPQYEIRRDPLLNNIAMLEKPVSDSALLSMVAKVLHEEKEIPNKEIDPEEMATTNVKNPPPAVVFKEVRTDRAEARSDETAALAFSRVGIAPIKKTAVNLDELIRQTLNDYLPQLKHRQIEWIIQPLGVVKADPSLLRLVFGNLVSNAVKFTGGRTNPKIEIGRTGDSTSEAVFFVRDNGVGFDPKYTDKISGLLRRSHSEEEFKGTGLGLANVQRIIVRHGGRVWAEGAVGVGATFFFSMPK